MSSFPAAVDWLVANLRTAVQAAVPTAVVSDGWPTEAAHDEVVVGITPRDDESEGDHEWVAIGQNKVDEEYDLPIEITSWRGGSSQKLARDACKVLLDAAVTKIRSDLSLGGAVSPYPVRFGRFTWVPTREAGEAGDGRRQSVLFNLHIQNRF
jgi:hypothetical protein